MHSRTSQWTPAAAFALLLLACVCVATAQQPDSSRSRARPPEAAPAAAQDAPPAAPDHKFVVFKLQHNAAESVVSLLENVLPSLVRGNDLRLAADSRTNSILAAGTESALAKVESMLRALDVAEQEQRADAAAEVKIFTLEHVSAREAAETLRTLYMDQGRSPFQRQMAGGRADRRVAIAADERANSVIASGDKALLTEIEAILTRLDQPQPREDERQTEVIGLQSAPAADVGETLRRLGLTRVEVVADSTANLIILRGDRKSVEEATQLLSKVYQGQQAKARDVRLRVVWLVSPGLAGDGAADPPQNLEKVLNTLKSKAGVGDLKMAAQFLLNASGGSGGRQLRATGTTTIQSGRADIELEAMIHDAPGRSPQLEIQVHVGQASQTGSSTICNLNTLLSAPPGHPVVLGMTPIDSMESVFIIEILPPDEAAEPQPARRTGPAQ